MQTQTPEQIHDLVSRLCAAYLKGEAGEHLTVTEFCAMTQDEQDCYHMGGQKRRETM